MPTEDHFCPLADKPVRLVRARGPNDIAANDAAPQDATCLDMNHRCTAEMCPVTHVPRSLMSLRLARFALPSDTHRAIACCPHCNRETVHEVAGWEKAMCTSCHAVSRWPDLPKP